MSTRQYYLEVLYSLLYIGPTIELHSKLNVHAVNKYDKIPVMCDNYIDYIQQINFMT